MCYKYTVNWLLIYSSPSWHILFFSTASTLFLSYKDYSLSDKIIMTKIELTSVSLIMTSDYATTILVTSNWDI